MCGGCLRLSVLSIVEGQKVGSPGKFSFTRGYSLNSQQVESSLLFFFTQGVKGMTPLKTALGIVFIICLTIVISTFITRGRLCEFSIKSEHQEVAAKLACNAG
jgi:hypothetical protein